MGRLLAEDLAGSMLSVEDQVRYHLRGNHYPPVPVAMVGPCVEAIEAMNDEDPNRSIIMPKGISYRGQDQAPAWAIAEGHHLESWIHSWAWED